MCLGTARLRSQWRFTLKYSGMTTRTYSSSEYTVSASQGASGAEVSSARLYCSNLLQKYDSPSYTLQTFIPPAARDAYLTIRAFNIDIARVADSVSNPTIGAMRMQFWRDNINKTFAGSPPKQPAAILLAHVLEDLAHRTGGKARLSKNWFMKIISTREQYMNNPPYPTITALESYAENTYSTLLYLTLSALPLTSITADHLASHIGKATGITAILRGLPLLAFPPPPNDHSNRAALGGALSDSTGGPQAAVTLPLDVMAEHGVKEEDVLRQGSEAPGLRDAVFAVATRASDHLITAREMLKNIHAGKEVGHDFEHEGEEGHEYDLRPYAGRGTQAQIKEVETAFGVLMPAVATKMWLDKLQGFDFDVFQPELRGRDWKLPWKAYFAYRRRMF